MTGIIGSPTFSTPFGEGTPLTTTAPPDPSNGARFISIIDRDYRLSATTGDYERMPTTRQRVLLALLSVELPSRIDPAGLQKLETAVRDRLNDLVQDGSIRIDAFAFDESPKVGLLIPTLSYTDLSTLQSDVLTI